MEKERKSFILYMSYKKHLELLSYEDIGRLTMALFDYAENGTVPNLDGMAMMAFSFISAQMDLDLSKYKDICQKRSEAGRLGAEAKKANAKTDKQKQANKADNDNDDDNDDDNDNDLKTTPPIVPPNDAPTSRFDTFWSVYPKKVGKKAARTAWKRIKMDKALFDRIIAAVEKAKQSQQWKKNGGQYIPNPATWLNQGRWDDELPISSTFRPTGNTLDVLSAIIDEEEGGEPP